LPLDELGRWLQARAERRPVATSIPTSTLRYRDRAGPVSISPLDWICPLPHRRRRLQPRRHAEFAAISAVVRRHNDISNTLSTAPHQFEPIHQRKPNGEVDARPCAWDSTRHAAAIIGLGATARHPQHQPRPAASILRHCVETTGIR